MTYRYGPLSEQGGSNENDPTLQDDGKKGELQKNLHLAGHTAAATRQQQLAKSPNELDESTSGRQDLFIGKHRR
jgi:hypothetical protein